MNEIWTRILDRDADWSEIIDFLRYCKTKFSKNFNTLQLLVFADFSHYTMIHHNAGDPVEEIFYSYLEYFFWDLVDSDDE